MEDTQFRAWDIEGKGFINGFNMIGFSTGQGGPTPKLQRYNVEWSMDKVIIEQYTGRKGTCAGDIIMFIPLDNMSTVKQKAVIKYDKDRACFMADGLGWYIHLYKCQHIEIIGNIHQNPKLLK